MPNILSDEFQETVNQELKVLDPEKDNYENLSIQHRYFSLLIKSKKELIQLQRIMDKVYQEKYHYYKFNYDYQLKQSEIEIYMRNNEEYKQILNTYELKKLEVEVLEETVKRFQNRGFTIKNAIEFMKLERP